MNISKEQINKTIAEEKFKKIQNNDWINRMRFFVICLLFMGIAIILSQL